MTHSSRYIVVRESDGFISLIVGPIRYPLTSKGWNQRTDGKSHIQAMRHMNRSDIYYHRGLGKTVTIEREYPKQPERGCQRAGQIELTHSDEVL